MESVVQDARALRMEVRMAEYVGLDVSMKETAVSVRRDGKRVWRGKCPSDPKVLADLLRRRASEAACIVFETGPLSIWFYHMLSAEGLPVVCIDARHAKAALDMAANKTDANDADGLAHLAEVGFFSRCSREGLRQHGRSHIGFCTYEARDGDDRSLEPDPGVDEDVRAHRAGRQGEPFRGKRSNSPRRTRPHRPRDPAPAGGLARRSPARN